VPGTYTVKVVRDGREAETTVQVLPDPRFAIPETQRRAKEDAVLHAGALQEALTDAVERILETRGDIERVLSHADRAAARLDDGEDDPNEALREAARELQDSLAVVEKKLRQPPGTRGIVADDDAMSRVRQLIYLLSSSWDAPTAAQRQLLAQVTEQADQAVAECNHVYRTEVEEFAARVAKAGLGLFAPVEPVAVPRRASALGHHPQQVHGGDDAHR